MGSGTDLNRVPTNPVVHLVGCGSGIAHGSFPRPPSFIPRQEINACTIGRVSDTRRDWYARNACLGPKPQSSMKNAKPRWRCYFGTGQKRAGSDGLLEREREHLAEADRHI